MANKNVWVNGTRFDSLAAAAAWLSGKLGYTVRSGEIRQAVTRGEAIGRYGITDVEPKPAALPGRTAKPPAGPRPAKRRALLSYPPGHGPHEDWNEWRRYV
ncbi:MAG: hypothetical protein LBF77_03725 [Spirochaetaceae bacterium]|jgi:ribosomal protein S6E (S10)|nr:hypothetical protein [Spirochaetaceae bacterium]